MATIINNPGNKDGSDSSSSVMSLIIGVILLLVVIGLFFVYALPAMRVSNTAVPQNSSIDVNLKLPVTGTGGASPAPTPPPATPGSPAY